MFQFLKKLQKKFLDMNTLPLKLVLFNIVILMGIVGGGIGFVMSVMIGSGFFQIILILMVEIVLFLYFYLANWKNNLNTSAIGLIALVTLLLFPLMFFINGGAFGGMGYWYAIGILFTFLLVDGIALYILVILQIIIDATTYVVGYFFPELIINLENDAAVAVDMLQSMLVLSMAIGLIIRLQSKIYKNALEKIEHQNEELKRSEQKAEKANRAKTDFLSNMSHEIRTPLNAILGMNEMILRESSEVQIVNYATVMQNSSQVLLSIINDILDVSKIEEGKIELVKTEYELSSLLNDCYQMTAQSAEQKNLLFTIEAEESLPNLLFGDMVRIRQILINLLSNSVKYTEQGYIRMRVWAKENRQNYLHLVFEVSDSGIGMTKENLENVFQKFERFDLEKNQSILGTGLGMSIAKELTQLMNGTIEPQSEYGVGTTFTVTLPQVVVSKAPIGKIQFTKENKATMKKHEQSGVRFDGVRLLVVDDMEVNQMVVRNLLKETGAVVDAASSGAECLEKCRENEYDMILMDQMMPGMNGSETMAKLRQSSQSYGTSIPVVMLTANALSGMKEKFMQEGFSDYITKPVTAEALEHVILSLLPEEKGKKETVTYVDRMQSLAKDIPELDLESALPYCAHNSEFLFEVMEKYFMGDRIANMEQAYQSKAWKSYQIEAHTLKSSAKTFGLNALSEQAQKLEDAAKENDIQWIETNHSSIMQKLLQIKELVGKYTDTPDTEKTEETKEESGENNEMSEEECKVRKLLVVDDEETNIRLITFALKSCVEYEVIGAGSGEKALELLHEETVDLVLLDVKMPGMDGFETLRHIREFSKVPVMFLSGDTLDDKQEELKKQGVAKCLKKPVGPAMLKEVLQQFFLP